MSYQVTFTSPEGRYTASYATRADALAALNRTSLPGYRPEPIQHVATDGDVYQYRNHTRARFIGGQWTYPAFIEEDPNVEIPWIVSPRYRSYGESWANDPIYDMAVHVSEEDPAQVAYAPDLEKGIAGRYTRTTPGRFLKKFTTLTDDQIAQWAARCSPIRTFGLADTPETIRQVYQNLTNTTSCMSGQKRFDLHGTPHAHPAEVYGAGDLAIAYTGTLAAPTARVICWPAKLVYLDKAYGPKETVLKTLLQAAGYRAYQQDDTPNPFVGARVRRVDAHHGRSFVMPYVDCAQYADATEKTTDDGHPCFLLSGNGDYLVRSSDYLGGTIPYDDDTDDPEYDYTCDRCETSLYADDTRFIGSDGDTPYCYRCYTRYTAACHDCGDRFTTRDLTERDNGQTTCDGCYEAAHCGATCNIDGCADTFNHYDRTPEQIRVGLGDCCDDHAARYTHFCDTCGHYVDPADLPSTPRSADDLLPLVDPATATADSDLRVDGIRSWAYPPTPATFDTICDCGRAVLCLHTVPLPFEPTTPDADTPTSGPQQPEVVLWNDGLPEDWARYTHPNGWTDGIVYAAVDPSTGRAFAVPLNLTAPHWTHAADVATWTRDGRWRRLACPHSNS